MHCRLRQESLGAGISSVVWIKPEESGGVEKGGGEARPRPVPNFSYAVNCATNNYHYGLSDRIILCNVDRRRQLIQVDLCPVTCCDSVPTTAAVEPD